MKKAYIIIIRIMIALVSFSPLLTDSYDWAKFGLLIVIALVVLEIYSEIAKVNND